MEEALRSLIAANPGVSAKVASRIYWGLAPQKVTGDYIRMSVISGPRDYHMQGDSGLVAKRVQCDCWASTALAAKQIARALVAAVTGYSGAQSSVTFQSIFIDSERDDYESKTGDVATRFRTIIDLIVWHA